MCAKRGQTDLSGVLLVDKPTGPSSHDIVASLRQITGERRIGHAGTLDPLASGLLVALIGPATRLSDFLIAQDKTYTFTVCFGSATDTDDSMGTVIGTAPIPAQAADPAFAATVLAGMVGPHAQVPPQYSAIKTDGKKAYQTARRGGMTDLAPRSIEIFACDLIGVDSTPGASEVAWRVRARVSKGTYIRALARDLGVSLGSLAHLTELRRISSGPAAVDDAVSIEALRSLDGPTVVDAFCDPLPLLGCPVVDVDDSRYRIVATGGRLPVEVAASCGAVETPALVSIVHNGRLVALYRLGDDTGIMEAQAVFPGGIHARRP